MRPADSCLAPMRPLGHFEFETPDLDRYRDQISPWQDLIIYNLLIPDDSKVSIIFLNKHFQKSWKFPHFCMSRPFDTKTDIDIKFYFIEPNNCQFFTICCYLITARFLWCKHIQKSLKNPHFLLSRPVDTKPDIKINFTWSRTQTANFFLTVNTW